MMARPPAECAGFVGITLPERLPVEVRCRRRHPPDEHDRERTHPLPFAPREKISRRPRVLVADRDRQLDEANRGTLSSIRDDGRKGVWLRSQLPILLVLGEKRREQVFVVAEGSGFEPVEHIFEINQAKAGRAH